ncbi:MAG TPA: NAD-dependent epimerase/dehydratase family protein, partial [Conexibacter sp.]|nr:NAD-dependent epimerase/dehydratase family protein [Conexibacter sp.]
MPANRLFLHPLDTNAPHFARLSRRRAWVTRASCYGAMRILLTGVSGFVGARLVPRLLRDGHELRGFARDPSRV